MAAKQFGTHRLSGTVGDVTYSQTKSGFKARQKTRVNKAERLTAPQFQAWRDHTSEFAMMASDARTFRTAFTELNWNIRNKELVQQALQKMNLIRKTDSINPRGQRRAASGDLSQLIGFDFTGTGGGIHTALQEGFSSSFDRSTGEVAVTIQKMIPKHRLTAPGNATHFKLTMGAAILDFEQEASSKVMAGTSNLLIDVEELDEMVLTETLLPNSTLPVIIVLKLEFVSEINGYFYPVMSNAAIGSSVIHVDQL